jgi:error-prone DNA polymerase
MTRKGLSGTVQEEIVEQIASFALYGFPESHAASFALIAYASAYLKCHYLAAFTAATLNNQPMGFYQPFTIIKDAQRHGLKVRPVDVTRSEWRCTVEHEGGGSRVLGEGVQSPKSKVHSQMLKTKRRTSHVELQQSEIENQTLDIGAWTLDETTLHPTPHTRHPALRLGLLCVKGLREDAGRAIVRAREERPFTSIDDLHQRVPELRKDELRKLAAVGALNSIQVQSLKSKVQRQKPKPTFDIGHWTLDQPHRRDALWQVERVARDAGPLYETLEEIGGSPLRAMDLNERLNADLRGTGITIGRHPMAHQRAWLDTMKVTPAGQLKNLRNGIWVKVAGWVIVRQRPGTAKGFVFLSMEDETGISNIIVTPQLFETYRLALVNYPFLLIEGVLQHQDNVVSVKARKIEPLQMKVADVGSHDFH